MSQTTAQLDLNLAGMLTGARGAIPDGTADQVGAAPRGVSVRYRPRFTFQTTL